MEAVPCRVVRQVKREIDWLVSVNEGFDRVDSLLLRYSIVMGFDTKCAYATDVVLRALGDPVTCNSCGTSAFRATVTPVCIAICPRNRVPDIVVEVSEVSYVAATTSVVITAATAVVGVEELNREPFVHIVFDQVSGISGISATGRE